MDIIALADSPAASFLSAFSPTVKDIVTFVREHRETVRNVIPVITAARKEGPAVIDAVRKNAPELIEALKVLIASAPRPGAPVRAALVSDQGGDVAMENVLRNMAGHPTMSIEEQNAFMNRMTPGNDPSQENSRYTVG